MPAASKNSDSSNAEDIAWMEAAKIGDQQAFRQLVEKHQHAVVGTIAKMLGSPTDAEDLGQQVFLRVWKSAQRYQPTAKFTTWLFTITRNLVFNETKRQSRRRTESLDEQRETLGKDYEDRVTLDPAENSLHSELLTEVDQAIAELPEKQKLAVILRLNEKLPYEEIATILECSLSAVKSQLFRARETLKESLAHYLD